jgi:hypothetical protein
MKVLTAATRRRVSSRRFVEVGPAKDSPGSRPGRPHYCDGANRNYYHLPPEAISAGGFGRNSGSPFHFKFFLPS